MIVTCAYMIITANCIRCYQRKLVTYYVCKTISNYVEVLTKRSIIRVVCPSHEGEFNLHVTLCVRFIKLIRLYEYFQWFQCI